MTRLGGENRIEMDECLLDPTQGLDEASTISMVLTAVTDLPTIQVYYYFYISLLLS